MITLKHGARNMARMLYVAVILLYGSDAFAQNATQACRPAQVIPLTGTEPAAKLVIDPPLPGPLASRGVVVVPVLCGEHAPCTGIRLRRSGGLTAGRPRSCDRRRRAVALGGRKRQPAHPSGNAARYTPCPD